MKLYKKQFGNETLKKVLIIHGLFGSLTNWVSLAKRFSKYFHVILVDIRNHGKSPHSKEFNYLAMSKDIKMLLDDLNTNLYAMIGHSMGGKIAMQFALDYPNLLHRLIVVDIAPKYYKPHHQKILTALKTLDLNSISSRMEAYKKLVKELKEEALCQFLLQNLVRQEEDTTKFKWRMNLSVIDEKIEEIGKTFELKKRIDTSTLFIKGSESSYITDKDKKKITTEFTRVGIVEIKDVGHWVHAQNPDLFFKVCLRFLAT